MFWKTKIHIISEEQKVEEIVQKLRNYIEEYEFQCGIFEEFFILK